jgi:hypothetical protein
MPLSAQLRCSVVAWIGNGIASAIAFPNGVWERGQKDLVGGNHQNYGITKFSKLTEFKAFSEKL